MTTHTDIVTVEIFMNNYHGNTFWFKFLSHVADYIQTTEFGMPITPNQLVTYAMDKVEHEHYCLTSYTDLLSLMASLGLLNMERVGRTHKGESVYERTQ